MGKCPYNECPESHLCKEKTECTMPNEACNGCFNFKNSLCKGGKKSDFYYPDSCKRFQSINRKYWRNDGKPWLNGFDPIESGLWIRKEVTKC